MAPRRTDKRRALAVVPDEDETALSTPITVEDVRSAWLELGALLETSRQASRDAAKYKARARRHSAIADTLLKAAVCICAEVMIERPNEAHFVANVPVKRQGNTTHLPTLNRLPLRLLIICDSLQRAKITMSLRQTSPGRYGLFGQYKP